MFVFIMNCFYRVPIEVLLFGQKEHILSLIWYKLLKCVIDKIT